MRCLEKQKNDTIKEHKSKINVLLIDDDEDYLNLAQVYLKREADFLKLEITDSPEEAIKKLENDDFDVIVSDYVMPKVDGLDLLDKVRNRFGDIPFILFTGKGCEEVAMEAVNKGANAYVVKKEDIVNQFKNLAEKLLALPYPCTATVAPLRSRSIALAASLTVYIIPRAVAE